ncbi:MAG TPA: hypothetical protein VIL07_09330 [Symbiobacteriaceae bacterium]
MMQYPGYVSGWYPLPVPPVPYMPDLMMPGVVAICLMTGLPGVAGVEATAEPTDFIDVTPEPMAWEHPAASAPVMMALPELRLSPASGDADGVPVWAARPVELLPDEPVEENA